MNKTEYRLNCQINLITRGNETKGWKDVRCPVCGRMSCVYVGQKESTNEEITDKYYEMVKEQVQDYFGIVNPEQLDLYIDFGLTCIKKALKQ